MRASRATFATLTMTAVVTLLLCGPAPGSPGGCESAIPPAGPDRVLTNLRALEVVGLYKTLWSFRARRLSGNGPIVDRLTTNGHTVEVQTTSTVCTNLGTASAWTKAWSCALELSGRFAFKKVTYGSIVRGGEGVSTTTTFNPADLSSTDTIAFDETLTFDWDAGRKRLTIAVTYPGSGQRNHERTWGVYAMHSRSLARVAVPPGFVGAVGAMSDSPFPLYANLGAPQSAPTSVVDANLSGHPFWADRGLLSFTRQPPDSETQSQFAIEMVWGTDARMDLTAGVAGGASTCGGNNVLTVALNGQGLSREIPAFTPAYGGFFQAFESSATEQTACVPWSEPLVGSMRFRAGDAFAASCAASGCAGETVGARFLAKLHTVDKQDGTCERWYDLGATLLVNWGLTIETPSGETGGGFDLGSGSAIRDWPSARHFDASYGCP